jgi:hypothetical protein
MTTREKYQNLEIDMYRKMEKTVDNIIWKHIVKNDYWRFDVDVFTNVKQKISDQVFPIKQNIRNHFEE